jgi:plastocyanin
MEAGKIILITISILILATASCTTQPAQTQNQSPTNSASTPGSINPEQSTRADVAIQGFAFSPKEITIKKGTTITWTNLDSAAHTITSNVEGGPKSTALQQGDTYQFTFENVGNYDYHCSIHPSMTGTIIVTQ